MKTADGTGAGASVTEGAESVSEAIKGVCAEAARFIESLESAVETLRELAAESPPGSRELFLILGADNLTGLADWRAIEEILVLAQPVVIHREGHPEELLEALDDKLTGAAVERLRAGLVHAAPVEISSTVVPTGELSATSAIANSPSAHFHHADASTSQISGIETTAASATGLIRSRMVPRQNAPLRNARTVGRAARCRGQRQNAARKPRPTPDKTPTVRPRTRATYINPRR